VHVRFFSERLSWNSVYATVDGFVRFGCGSWMARMSMLFCSMSVKIEAGEKILCMFHVAHVRVSLVFLDVFEFLFCFVLLELDFLFLLLFVERVFIFWIEVLDLRCLWQIREL